METINKRHGGPYDRGAADSYYQRSFRPHYYVGGTYQSELVTKLTKEELEEYTLGWNENEAAGNFKEYY